jgi:hypothetical protein
MAQLDPTQGLVDFTLATKPFHTKVAEVIIEYVYTEAIVATVTDEMHSCVNIGVPFHDSVFRSPVVEVSLFFNGVYVEGNVTHSIINGQKVEISGSTANDAVYHVDYHIYDPGKSRTLVVFKESLTSIVNDGELSKMTLDYCQNAVFDTLQRPYVLPEEVKRNITRSVSCQNGWGIQWDDYGVKGYDRIKAYNLTTNTISLLGDVRDNYMMNQIISIMNSRNNDGKYHIAEVSYDEDNSWTVLRVLETIVYDPANKASEYGQVKREAIGFDENTVCLDAPYAGLTSTFINDRVQFTWYVPNEFSHAIIAADVEANTVTVAGNQLTDLQIGQDIKIAQSPSNDGTYKISNSEFVTGNTVLILTPDIIDSQAGGNVINTKSINLDQLMSQQSVQALEFRDTISVTTSETTHDGAGSVDMLAVGAFDNNHFDYDIYDANTDILELLQR